MSSGLLLKPQDAPFVEAEPRKDISRRGFMGFLGGIFGAAVVGGGVAATVSKLVAPSSPITTEADWGDVKKEARKSYFFAPGDKGWTIAAEGITVYGGDIIHERFVTLPRRLDLTGRCHIDIDEMGEVIREELSRRERAHLAVPAIFGGGNKWYGASGLVFGSGREETVISRKGVEIWRGKDGRSYGCGRFWEKGATA